MRFKNIAILTLALGVAAPAFAQDVGIQAYTPAPRTSTNKLNFNPAVMTGEIIIKFSNATKGRAALDGQSVHSLANRDLRRINKLINRLDLTVAPAINKPQSTFDGLNARMAAVGKEGPDLGGMIKVTGSEAVIEQAAKALNEEGIQFGTIDWVQLAKINTTGDGTDDAQCGSALSGNCWKPGGNDCPFCDDVACCDTVCDIDPFCCDENIGLWDAFCAATANAICQPHTPNWDPTIDDDGDGFEEGGPANSGDLGPDRCVTPLSGSCFESHLGGGCNNQRCCNLVCQIEPTCCETFFPGWSVFCVQTAWLACTELPENGPTPNFEEIQGYLNVNTYGGFADIPEALLPFIPLLSGDGTDPFVGFDGFGYDLFTPGEPFDDENGNKWFDAGEPFDDLDGDGIWDRPTGLWGIAEALLRQEGVDQSGEGNLTRGKTTKVGVVEWGYWPDHEDLKVTSEPGQTIILIPEIAENDHATACLSIIGGKDNNKGVRGIVPEADMFFFPLASVEEASRALDAWTAAIEIFDAGDVLSASYGPGGDSLNNQQDTWTLFRLASDLGITVCMAAGNSCANLDDSEDLGDSGAIVVGACSPGRPHYRLSFSNYCTAPSSARSNVVHVRAWGELVTAAGYGELFEPTPIDGVEQVNRSYTALFNGTSAACPQVAGLVAAIQGFSKQVNGIPLSPERVRDGVLGAPNRPEPPGRLFGGFPEGQLCNLDLDPGEGPFEIGPFPRTENFVPAFFNASVFADSPLVDALILLRGKLVQGNVNSIKGENDGAFLRLETEFTRPGDKPNNKPTLASPSYIGQGQQTSFEVIGHSEDEIVNSMRITANRSIATTNPAIQLVELYDWNVRRYMFAGFSFMTAAPTEEETIINDASRFVEFGGGAGSRILIHFNTIVIGVGSPIIERTDFINLELSSEFIFEDEDGDPI